MKPLHNYYAILGVDENATSRQIRTAFRQGVLEHHPDRHGNAEPAQERTILLKQAYDVLIDADRRVEHDRLLRRDRAASVAPPSVARQSIRYAPVMTPTRPRRSFGWVFVTMWLLVEACLFTADRILPRLQTDVKLGSWLSDSFTGESLLHNAAIDQGDADFLTASLGISVGFLCFLITSALVRLVGRNPRA